MRGLVRNAQGHPIPYYSSQKNACDRLHMNLASAALGLDVKRSRLWEARPCLFPNGAYDDNQGSTEDSATVDSMGDL